MNHDFQKRIVALAYDKVADLYLDRFGLSSVRSAKLAELVKGLPQGASVLDLGCGAGIPVARELVRQGFHVTGVDASSEQIKRARCNVPEGSFVHADMATVQFAPETFDAVAAFYSITHLPRAEHAALIKQVAIWLRPGGRFLASYGTKEGDCLQPWLGTSMFFSHQGPQITRQIIKDAGFGLRHAETVQQDNEEAAFLWIMAEKS